MKSHTDTLAQPATEYAWLIEAGWTGTASIEYWCGCEVTGGGGILHQWSFDHSRAIRFARQEDAKRMANILIDGEAYRIVEHGWDAAQPPAAPVETKGDRYVHIDNVIYHLDDVEVDADGKCAWTDVANALTHIKLCIEIRTAPHPLPRSSAGNAGLTPDLMNATTVSCTGLDITIACNDHGTKDALMDVLVDAAYMPAQPQGVSECAPLRLCSYCKTWNSKPCGEQCCWSPTDPIYILNNEADGRS